jgi:hypothetical protein
VNTLDVIALILCVLPDAISFPVDTDLAVFLHLELVVAVVTCETVSRIEPVIVVKLAHFERIAGLEYAKEWLTVKDVVCCEMR